MYKQKIAITINSDFDRDKLYDEFILLMKSLCRTGQIMGGFESPYVAENELICYQTTLEQNSLDSIYNNEWVNLRIKNLEEGCNSRLKIEVLGEHIPFYKDVCTCDLHDSYLLFTTYLNEGSAIECGSCGGAVPIYKIKGLTDKEQTDIESWEGDYISCDNLNMGCGVGEKWATKQMSDPTSQLSQVGRELCKRIAELSGVSTYYYLYNYRTISIAKDKLRKCPSCNGDWLLNDKWLGFYDFRCNRCKLASTLTSRS